VNKLTKILLVVFALVIAGIAAMVAAVHFFLTDERIRGVVVPIAEKTLGRDVQIGSIDVSVLNGITIKDFAIKEEDKSTNFISTDSFILRYDLAPVLQKKLVVSEILLKNPSIRLSRDTSGTFNFQSLKMLAEAKENLKESKNQEKAAAAALPIALTVNQIRIENAQVAITDQKKEIPETKASANLSVSLKLGSTISSLEYAGSLKAVADSIYGELKPHLIVSSEFNNDTVDYNVDLKMGKEDIHVEGKITNYTKAPDILVNVSSPEMNLDRLLAIPAAIPKKDTGKQKQSPEKKAAGPQKAIAESIPPGVTVHGQVKIGKTVYKQLNLADFIVNFELKDGIAKISDLTANTAGGQIGSQITADLNNTDPDYTGSLSAKSLDVTKLGTGLGQSFADILTGTLESAITFSGKGLTPDIIKKNLAATASYTITDGMIKSTPTTKSIAAVTGLKDLETIQFSDMAGDVEILKGGKVKLTTAIKSNQLHASTTSQVDLDGNMNFPIVLTVSKDLTAKLDKSGNIAKFLANDQGQTELRLKVAGTFKTPKTSLDTAHTQKMVEKAVKSKINDEVNRLIEKQMGPGGENSASPAGPALNILKGFLGI